MGVTFIFRGFQKTFLELWFYNTVEGIKMRFYGYSFLPTVLEAVLEAARQKTNVVPYLNQSPLFIGYGFYNYDIIIDSNYIIWEGSVKSSLRANHAT